MPVNRFRNLDPTHTEKTMLPDLHQPQATHDQEARAPLPGMSLHDFMERTSLYEQTPVPFPFRLRRATWTGLVLTLISSLILLLLPFFVRPLSTVQFPFFPSGLHSWREGYVRWLLTSPLMRYCNGALIGSAAILLLLTRNLRNGNIGQQWIAFVQAIGGCINCVLMLVLLMFILLDLLMWILALSVLVLVVTIVLVIVFEIFR